jgi:hypothetical protein
MTVEQLIHRLVCIGVSDPQAEIVVADSPFCDGDVFTVDLVTTDTQDGVCRVVLSPDVVLRLREHVEAEG